MGLIFNFNQLPPRLVPRTIDLTHSSISMAVSRDNHSYLSATTIYNNTKLQRIYLQKTMYNFCRQIGMYRFQIPPLIVYVWSKKRRAIFLWAISFEQLCSNANVVKCCHIGNHSNNFGMGRFNWSSQTLMRQFNWYRVSTFVFLQTNFDVEIYFCSLSSFYPKKFELI
jgi:hypothetical protein